MKDHYIVLVTTTPFLHASTRELATRLAGRANAVLMFLHITPIRRTDGEALLYTGLQQMPDMSASWLRAQTPSDASVRYQHRSKSGEPEEVVERFVRGHDVDLVVIEEPPRNWVAEALWRGLAERLIRRVDCPVVIGGPGFLRSAPTDIVPVRSPLDDTTVAELLNAMVEARVDALRTCMDHTADAVRRIADSETVRHAVAETCRAGASLDRRDERRLTVEMDEHRRALRAVGWQLTVGAHTYGPGAGLPSASPVLAEFLARVQRQGQSTSLPLPIQDGQDGLAVLSAAAVDDGEGVLWFMFNAEADFLRILGQPGPLPSFETYAFDEHGLMLSNSRFPDHLLQAGLLPEGIQTPLRLRVAEPSEGPIDAWPLTRCAQQAILHKDGFDTMGYRDYRGIPVVGAWRWVSEYDFGVAAEVDRVAAFR